ncbi:MAG: EAL domain-containing protein [Sulfurimonas sp.]|nr:EAL domain-containing protein [Sulfurimonas sp.]
MNEIIENLNKYAKKMSVLYVEDNEEVRASTSLMLQRTFGNVLEASDGLEGLQRYKCNSYVIDLVVTDINMPNMNGIEMIKEIKKIDHTQQVLVVSAYGESEYFIQTIKLGIDGYLLKPTVTEQFLEALAISVDKIRLKKENVKYQKILEGKNSKLVDLNDLLEIKVKNRTQELEEKLYIDDLTGLKSRFKLDLDIKDVDFPVLILIDIDDFHSINELFGTNDGDEILKSFAKLLKEYTQTKYYDIYRISGDQFVLFESAGFIDHEKIEMEVKELFELVLRTKFFLKENREYVELAITMGIVIEKEKILSKADMALCYAKDNNIKFSTYHLNIDSSVKIANTAKWFRILNRGLKDDLFIACLQPIVNREQKIIKHEALMRLVSEEDSIDSHTSPEDFLPIAIQTKQYSAISYLVIKKAFKLLENRMEDISINLAYQDIKNRELIQFLKKTLSDKEIAKRIVFEIVESEDIGNFEIVEDFIKTFKELGVRIAIDDFGTGYSNFTHIMKLKPDYIKIDGSLIKNIDTDKDSFELVKAIVQFSKELNIKTIAEYVYNKEVFDIVFNLGVDEFQGYYFGKPFNNYSNLPFNNCSNLPSNHYFSLPLP